MKNRDYITCIQSVLQLMDEGVHIVDPEGRSVVYNRAMAQLEKMETRDVLRKPFSEVFKGLTPESSTLLQALETGKSTWKKEQTYLNKDGKQITTMNTTVPVIEDGKVIGMGDHDALMRSCAEYRLIAESQMGTGEEADA